MAKATKRVTEVPVTTYTEKVEGYTLELTIAEAKVLAVICGKVGGRPSNTCRKETSQIMDALILQGVSWDNVGDDHDNNRYFTGTLEAVGIMNDEVPE